MSSKKSNSEGTKSTHQKIDEGAQVPGIQAIIEPEHKKGALVPSIQPIVKPDTIPQPAADIQPPADTQPTPDTQPETTPEPESSGTGSSK